MLNIEELRPAVAFVITYEVLFGQVQASVRLLVFASTLALAISFSEMQGCRVKGKAEKAVFSLKVCCTCSSGKHFINKAATYLTQPDCLQPELQQHLQAILIQAGVEHVDELLTANLAKDWPRTARVNLLKISVGEALTWLRSPPSPYQNLASLVCTHTLQLQLMQRTVYTYCVSIWCSCQGSHVECIGVASC